MTPSTEDLKKEKRGRGHYSRAVDYSSIPVPDPEERPFNEWTAQERKAYLLELILERGSSSMICRTDIAGQFQVSIPRITQDLQCLDKWLGQNLQAERVHAWAISSFQKAHTSLLEREQYKEAFQLVMDFSSYLAKLGIVVQVPEKHELSGGLEIVFQTIKKE